MSSPNENSGPPPDAPRPQPTGSPPTDTPQTAPAAAETPTPAASTSEAATAPIGTDGQQETQPGATPGSQGQRGRRPISSLSFFFPFNMPRPENGATPQPNPGQAGQGDDGRVGLTWTIEFVGDDGMFSGGAGGDSAHTHGAPAVPPETGDAGDAAGEPTQAQPAQPQPAGGAQGGDQQRPPGTTGPEQPRDMEGAIFLIFGPDGHMHPAGGPGDGGAAPPGAGPGAGPGGPGTGPGGAGRFPNLWFPGGLPFLFQSGPPAPDPAKAAELLASLPTIGRALLRRVDKIIVAEDTAGGKEYDERGWRCAICLEGLDLETLTPDSTHPVKGLPCNHLFHEECLQPWFTSHHTCPTCRLDLDPLRTLHGPRETRGNPLRPAATGSGRATPRNAPHPYARDRETASRSRTRPQTPANPTEANGADGVQTPAADENRPQTQNQPQHETQTPNQNQNEAQNPGPAQNQNEPGSGEVPPPASGAGAGPGPGTPPGPDMSGAATRLSTFLQDIFMQATAAAFNEMQGNMFNNPMTASPAHMDRSASASAGPREDAPSPTPAGPEAAGQEIPAADPRSPGAGEQPSLAGDPSTQPAASGLATPSGSSDGPSSAPPRPGLLRPIPERRPHIHLPFPPFLHRAFPSAPSDAPTPAAVTTPPPPNAEVAGDGLPGAPGEAANGIPRQFRDLPGTAQNMLPPLDFFFLRPGMAPPPGPDPTARPAREETPAPSQFVPQSLGSWTEQREKTLGWRCDAVECLVATPVPDETSEEMDVDEEAPIAADDKEMLSIYTPLQPPFSSLSGETKMSTSEFVLLACPHRWHRTCLETAERSAGHRATPDSDGREWVRCQKCRKEGWVTPRSEVEVVMPSA